MLHRELYSGDTKMKNVRLFFLCALLALVGCTWDDRTYGYFGGAVEVTLVCHMDWLELSSLKLKFALPQSDEYKLFPQR